MQEVVVAAVVGGGVLLAVVVVGQVDVAGKRTAVRKKIMN